MVDAGGGCQLGALDVGDQRPQRHVVGVTIERGHHVGGAGHGRDRLGTDERGDLEVFEAGVDQALDQLHALLGSHRLFALQSVAGHDVADPHPLDNRWVII